MKDLKYLQLALALEQISDLAITRIEVGRYRHESFVDTQCSATCIGKQSRRGLAVDRNHDFRLFTAA